MKCEKCIHYCVCVVNSYCHEPCGYYEEQRSHGEWIDKGEYAECSICGGCSGTQFNGVEPIALKTNFCPNCGARMSANDKQVTGKLDENTQKHYGFRKKY